MVRDKECLAPDTRGGMLVWGSSANGVGGMSPPVVSKVGSDAAIAYMPVSVSRERDKEEGGRGRERGGGKGREGDIGREWGNWERKGERGGKRGR